MATLEELVAIGVDWLLNSEQPDDAWMQHRGVTAPEVDNLRLRFIPSGFSEKNGHGPVVVVDRDHYSVDGASNVDNPLTDVDMERVVESLAGVGVAVASSWNGPPAITGSFGLDACSSPSLVAAVNRYHDGCPDHGGTVFCSHGPPHAPEPCDWYQRGHAKIVQPVWDAKVPA